MSYVKLSYDAWVNKDEIVETKALSVTIRMDDNYYNQFGEPGEADDIIKRQLCTKLIDDILKMGHIRWNKQKHVGFEQYTEYQARLNIADIRWSNIIVDQRKFQAHGREWTETQISKALLNTFPEYLI